MAYEVYIPRITSAVLSASSTTINAKIVLTVTVTEDLVYREPENRYSGEIFSGEV